MPRYAAFLRGINVGGHRASKDQLCSSFEGVGLTDVATFRASGNVVFTAGRASVASMTARIEASLEETLGYAAPTYLRSDKEMRAMAAQEPFDPKLVEASKGKLQVQLLLERPAARARKEVLALATDDDRLAFGDRELYWLPSGGQLESELDWGTIDGLLGVGTRRTKGTVDLIAAKWFAD
jgi:uncharacterized protein (DUF1697 family)